MNFDMFIFKLEHKCYNAYIERNYMNEGLLWYVHDQKNEIEKTIENAVDFFHAKYGHNPLACYVDPDLIETEYLVKDAIKVMPNEKVIKNHIWLEFPRDQ